MKRVIYHCNTYFNLLRPSDAYMHQQINQHWFRQLLIAWLVTSYYLNQCWDIVNWNLRNKLQWNFNWNSYIFIEENAFVNVIWKMAAILSRPQCVKHWWCVIVIVNYLVWSYWLWYETSISYWGLNKMVAILQTFSNAFYWTIFVVSLSKFHSSLSFCVQIDGLVQDCRGNAQNINNWNMAEIYVCIQNYEPLLSGISELVSWISCLDVFKYVPVIHFNVSITIHNWWKFQFPFNHFLIKLLPQNLYITPVKR